MQIAIVIAWIILSSMALFLGLIGRRRSGRRRAMALRSTKDRDILILSQEHIRLWDKWVGQGVITLLIGVSSLLSTISPQQFSTSASGWILTIGLFVIMFWLIRVEWLTLREQERIEGRMTNGSLPDEDPDNVNSPPDSL